MDSALNIAASGLDAATTLLNVAAENTANVNTLNYRTLQVDLMAQAGGGVEPGRVIANPVPNADLDPVALAMEYRRAEFLYDANAAVIAADEQMFGSLINILDNQPPSPPG
jgi:flagellar basal body rod protein FlgC